MTTALRQSSVPYTPHISPVITAGAELLDPEVPSGFNLWGVAVPKAPIYHFIQLASPPTLDVSGIQSEIAVLRTEVAAMKLKIEAALADQRCMTEQILMRVSSSESEIEIEEVDNTVAKERILKLFNEHPGSLFYDEIAERLNLPLRQTVEICNQLEQDGLIGEPTTKR